MQAKTHVHTKDDTSRQIKLLEVNSDLIELFLKGIVVDWKGLLNATLMCLLGFHVQERVAQLELDLDEERHSGDQLMDRVDRGREQVDPQHLLIISIHLCPICKWAPICCSFVFTANIMTTTTNLECHVISTHSSRGVLLRLYTVYELSTLPALDHSQYGQSYCSVKSSWIIIQTGGLPAWSKRTYPVFMHHSQRPLLMCCWSQTCTLPSVWSVQVAEFTSSWEQIQFSVFLYPTKANKVVFIFLSLRWSPMT